MPALVEGLLDFHFYDFTFQREVPTEGITNAAGTKWTRNSERQEDDNPSPKTQRELMHRKRTKIQDNPVEVVVK